MNTRERALEAFRDIPPELASGVAKIQTALDQNSPDLDELLAEFKANLLELRDTVNKVLPLPKQDKV